MSQRTTPDPELISVKALQRPCTAMPTVEPFYQDEAVTLYHGDCRRIVPLLSVKVDALVSDPPYGMAWNTDSTRFTGGKGYHNKTSPVIAGDDEPFDPSPWLGYPLVALWGSNHFGQRLPVGSLLVWVKKGYDKLGKFLSDAEVCWTSRGHGVYVFSHVWDGCARESENGEHFHTSQKPVVVMQWVFARLGVPEGGIVLDPYAGSGSTLLAAKLTGRRAIGIEINRDHCETTVNRLRQGVLFGAASA